MRRMSGRIHVEILGGNGVGPGPDGWGLLPYIVSVRCHHGSTSMLWRRRCEDGCHAVWTPGSRHHFLSCARVSPTSETLVEAGVVDHGQRMGCGCDTHFWMICGPRYTWDWEGGIQMNEGRLDAWENDALRTSMLANLRSRGRP